jgi:hypothetical protein
MGAKRSPDGHDGIFAGAPANHFAGLAMGFLWNERALLAGPAGHIPMNTVAGVNLRPRVIKAIESAVPSACDMRDGLAAALIDDPTVCDSDRGRTLRKT